MFGKGNSLLQKITSLIHERKEGEEKIAAILSFYVKRDCVPFKDFALEGNTLKLKVSAPVRSEILLHKEEVLRKINEGTPENIKVWDVK